MLFILVVSALTMVADPYAQESRDGESLERFTPPSSNPEDLYVFDGWVYFSAEDGRHGRELWRVNVQGKAELVKDIIPGSEGSKPNSFHEFEGALYFIATAPSLEQELWKTDGTKGGTQMVVRLAELPEISGRGPSMILGDGGGRLFVASRNDGAHFILREFNGANGEIRPLGLERGTVASFDVFHGAFSQGELYFGMTVGTRTALVRTHRGGAVEVLRDFDTTPTSFFVLPSGAVLFAAPTAEFGSELWITEGTADSTRMVRDIYPGAESSNIGEFHSYKRAEETTILFAATSPEHGREIWQTDGTSEGTRLWLDVIPGPANSDPYRFISFWSDLYFVATGAEVGREMWLYDGRNGHLAPVCDINPGLAGSHPYAPCMNKVGELSFSATDGDGDEEWWISPAYVGTASRVRDFNPGPAPSYPYYTVTLQDSLITVATSPVYGRELWIRWTDGTVKLLADIYTDASVNPSSSPQSITVAGDRLYFVANDIEHGRELWCSDGTEEGTYLVKDIFPGRASSNPAQLTPVGDLLYFVAEDGTQSFELWKSDGTPQGTVMFPEICIGGSARIKSMVNLNGILVFGAYRPLDGEELWVVLPGRQPHLLADINPGKGSSSPRDLVVWKGFAYFRADDGFHGEELWRTDGTEGGTVMVKDVVNAPVEHIGYSEIGVAFDELFLAAEIDHRGVELWRLDSGHNTLVLVQDIARNNTFDILRPPP